MSATVPIALCLLTGCASVGGGFTPPWKSATPKIDGPKDSLTLTGRTYERDTMSPKLRQALDTAERLMQEKKYAEAERLYHKLAVPGVQATFFSALNPFEPKIDGEIVGVEYVENKKKYPRSAYEEALFGEAEAQRYQKDYRTAAETYTKLLTEFPHSRFTTRACQGLFEIANHWLAPTREQMKEYQAQLKGERWFVTPALYVHLNNDMPFLDAEGHATAILNTIRIHDINGPLARQSLMYLGTIHFFRRDYKESDFYFTQLYESYPNTKDAATAIKQSIICKQLATGGTVYDLRGVEQSKKLLMTAQTSYPEFAEDTKWVQNQLISMNIQQADRDFKIAEFYQRTGHPGSAYFYYELVCRRYPGTNYAAKAQERKNDLRAKAEREQSQAVEPPPESRPTVTAPEPRLLPGLTPPGPLPPGLGAPRN